MKKHYNLKQVVKDLSKLPLFKLNYKQNGMILGECRSFYIRVLADEKESNRFKIQFGEKKTFDRWANSTNFETDNTYTKGLHRNNLIYAHKWAEKVCRTKLFDFDSYFRTLDLEWYPIKNV